MKNLHKNIGIFAASLLATSSAVYLYSPVIKSHADSSATAEISVTVGEVMSLSLNTNELNLSSNPNNFVSGTINATVSTNSQYGYTLALEDVDSNTNLVHTNENISDTISSSFSGSKTSSEMEANTWGFSLNSTDFFKVPANGSPVALKRTTTPMTTETETTPVDFGVKLGNITSGKYSDSVLFTMYVNGQDGKPSGADDPDEPAAESSQEMQAFACTELENVNDSAILTDSRDGNQYTVKKLADGNCWMTENLRIAGKSISSADSNLPSGESYEIPASNMNTFNYNYNEDSAYVELPYGGYYSFYTATAGWGTDSVASGNSPKDICPKGWRLPTGGDSGEFQVLYNHYNSPALMLGEPNFILTGRAEAGDVLRNAGGDGFYWSSSVRNTDRAYDLYLDTGEVYPTISRSKYVGLAVRCIAK
jgi:uncharacterized protein (TIGR02145 family)